MRPTGALHLGHYHGALKNWVRLQDLYECFFFVADWHALTTHYEEREVIETNGLRHGHRLARRRPRPRQGDALHPEPPARARRAVHAAGDGHAARLARARADLQGPDRAPEGPRSRDLRLPRLSAAAGGRHPDLQGRLRAGRRRPGAARRDHARGRAPLQPPLRPRARLRRARQGGAEEDGQGARKGIRVGAPRLPRRAATPARSSAAAAIVAASGSLTASDRERLDGQLRGTGKTILVEPDALLTETSKSCPASTAPR